MLPDGCALLDPGGRINRANPPLATLLEIPLIEMAGRLFTEFLDLEDAESVNLCLHRSGDPAR